METKKGKLIPYKDKNGEIILETIEQRFTRMLYTEPKAKEEEEEERGRTKRSIKLKPQPEPETTTKKKIKRKI